MTADWTQSLAGARMQVDQQFQPRVDESDFTSQEWGLIMTAVEFEIDAAGDPENAELYANTDKLPDIIPELQQIQREMGGSPTPVSEGSEGGFLGRLRSMVDGLTSDGSSRSDTERLSEAESLVQAYASDLQDYLETQGRWDDIRQAATEAETENAG